MKKQYLLLAIPILFIGSNLMNNNCIAQNKDHIVQEKKHWANFIDSCDKEFVNIWEKSTTQDLMYLIERLNAAVKVVCSKGCNDYTGYWLLAQFYCRLKNMRADEHFAKCFTCGPIKEKTKRELDNQRNNCATVLKGGSDLKRWGKPSKSSLIGHAKNNEPPSDSFSQVDFYAHIVKDDSDNENFYAGAFEASAMTEATSFWNNKLRKMTYSTALAVTANTPFLIYHGKNYKVSSIAKTEQHNLNVFSRDYSLQNPNQIITLFIIPPNKLTHKEKSVYRKFSPHFRLPTYLPKGQQGQVMHHGLQFGLFDNTQIPPYVHKRDFLSIVYQKDGIQLADGEVGFSNPYNNSAVCYQPNYVGAINHEILHLLISNNYASCPAWLNEGMAALFEACTGKNGTLVPNNNFRIKDIKGIVTDTTIDYLLTGDWPEKGNLSERMALSRYLTFYLYKRNILSPLFKQISNEISAGNIPSYNEVKQRMFTLLEISSTHGLTMPFNEFIRDQQNICMKKGKLKKRYTKGLYKSGFTR